jgi:hypothetical protein
VRLDGGDIVARKPDDDNRRAAEVNPTKSGIRTGNPQLEPHDEGEVRASPRKPRRRDAPRVARGERRGS